MWRKSLNKMYILIYYEKGGKEVFIIVKSNEAFQKGYDQSDITSKKLAEFLRKNGFDVEDFDFNEDFEECSKNKCPTIEHMGGKIPISRWLLFQKISRPDYVIKKTKPILIEIKHKNKLFLWVNKRDYPHYGRWSSILDVPLLILMFVVNDGWYVHKLITEDKLKILKAPDGNEVYDLKQFSEKVGDEKRLLNYLDGVK